VRLLLPLWIGLVSSIGAKEVIRRVPGAVISAIVHYRPRKPLLCARTTCNWLNFLAWLFSVLATVSLLAAIVLWPLNHLPCALGLGLDMIEWGVALSITGWLSAISGCRIFTWPPWP
jgi:hypothetical protein